MKGNKATIFSFAERCKNILASNWQGQLSTIKADAKGSKEEVYSSKVKFFLRKGRPYIWVPEADMHNVNTVIDERGSFSVASPFPGPLGSLLRSLKKFPARVALLGDVVPLSKEKVKIASASLRDAILSEHKVISESNYSVSGIISSSNLGFTSCSENLLSLLDGEEEYSVCKFDIRSCMFIDVNGGTHEVDLKEIGTSKADPLSPFSATLIDGINQSEMRRRALMLFCLTYLNTNVKDAYLLAVDRKGFDVLAKVVDPANRNATSGHQWREFRFPLRDEACDIGKFCDQLVAMEEEALENVSGYSGLG